jgi:hypothetical protein
MLAVCLSSCHPGLCMHRSLCCKRFRTKCHLAVSAAPRILTVPRLTFTLNNSTSCTSITSSHTLPIVHRSAPRPAQYHSHNDSSIPHRQLIPINPAFPTPDPIISPILSACISINTHPPLLACHPSMVPIQSRPRIFIGPITAYRTCCTQVEDLTFEEKYEECE